MVSVVKDGVSFIVKEDKVQIYKEKGYTVETENTAEEQPKKKRKKKGE